jgi:hypothetical protein
MPTLLRWNGFGFYFFGHKWHELAHIHVDKDKFSANFWLSPVRLAENFGFPYSEIAKLEKKLDWAEIDEALSIAGLIRDSN